MERAKNIVLWLVLSGGYFAVVWAGAVEGHQTAANIARFFVWPFLILSIFGLIATAYVADNGDQEDRENLAEKRPGAPRWVRRILSLATLLIMVGTGWFVTATAWMLHAVAGEIIGHTLKRLRTDLAESEATEEVPC